MRHSARKRGARTRMWKDQPLYFLGHGRNTNPMTINAKIILAAFPVYTVDLISFLKEETVESFLLARSLHILNIFFLDHNSQKT